MNKSRVGRTGDLSKNSIRGRISAPIPIVTDDDEFPLRSRGTGFSTPLGYEAEQQMRLPDTDAEDTSGIAHSDRGLAQTPLFRKDPIRLSHDAPRLSTTGGSRFRESGLVSPVASPAKSERKKGSLRSALGRLFGKKRKSDSPSPTNGHINEGGQHKHHKSDPTALLIQSAKPTSAQRSNSMPIDEHNRALTSHALFKDVQAPEAASPEESPRSPRPATIPRVLYNPIAPPIFPILSGLSPRPTSHGRDGAISRIGQAVTSGAHPNRRSRSLGHLRSESGKAQGVELPRRRSEEIRWWRESYDPAGPLSPWSSHRPDTAVTTQSQPEVAPLIEEDAMQKFDDGQEPTKEPKPFDFGPFMPSPALAGMKITQAANLEDRVLYLEEKLQKIEHVVAMLENRLSPQNTNEERPLPRALPSIPPRSDSRPLAAEFGSKSEHGSGRVYTSHDKRETIEPPSTPQQRSRSTTDTTRLSFSASPSDLSALPTSSPLPELSPASNFSTPESMGRPLSISAIVKGFHGYSMMPLSKHGSLTAHHYSALMNLIQAEQKARVEVEDKVARLERQLNALLTAMVYPNSGPQVSAERKRRGDALREMKGEMETRYHANSDSESEENSIYRERRDLQTPAEELSGYEFSGQEYEEELGVQGAGTPRTMSLSQMTLGKGQLHMQGVDF